MEYLIAILATIAVYAAAFTVVIGIFELLRRKVGREPGASFSEVFREAFGRRRKGGA